MTTSIFIAGVKITFPCTTPTKSRRPRRASARASRLRADFGEHHQAVVLVQPIRRQAVADEEVELTEPDELLLEALDTEEVLELAELPADVLLLDARLEDALDSDELLDAELLAEELDIALD